MDKSVQKCSTVIPQQWGCLLRISAGIKESDIGPLQSCHDLCKDVCSCGGLDFIKITSACLEVFVLGEIAASFIMYSKCKKVYIIQ